MTQNNQQRALERLQIVSQAEIQAEVNGVAGLSSSPRSYQSLLANLSLGVVCALAGAALSWFALTKQTVHAPSHATVSHAPAIIPTPQAGKLSVNGYVLARDKTTVSAETTGRLLKLFVKEGDHVTKGQVLAQLANSAEETRLKLLTSQAVSAELAVEHTQLQLRQQELAHQRNQALRQSGMLSLAAIEQSQQQWQLLENQLRRAHLELVQAKLNQQLAQTSYDNTFVRAPFSGLVLALNAQIGEIVSPLAGSGFVRSGICTIANMDSQVVEFDVTEKHLAQLHLGQAIQAVVDAYPELTFAARIHAIRAEVDRAKGTVRVHARFDQLDSRIRPDMGVRVSILPKS